LLQCGEQGIEFPIDCLDFKVVFLHPIVEHDLIGLPTERSNAVNEVLEVRTRHELLWRHALEVVQHLGAVVDNHTRVEELATVRVIEVPVVWFTYGVGQLLARVLDDLPFVSFVYREVALKLSTEMTIGRDCVKYVWTIRFNVDVCVDNCNLVIVFKRREDVLLFKFSFSKIGRNPPYFS